MDAYMVCISEMKPDLLDGTYRSPYVFWRDQSFVDAHLFLEAVMAAPHGQVEKFVESDGKIEAVLKNEKKLYGDNAALLQEGIYRYVDFMAGLLWDIQPRFDRQLAECMFGEILQKGLLDTCLRGLFCVNDSYCEDGDWVFNETTNEWELEKDR